MLSYKKLEHVVCPSGREYWFSPRGTPWSIGPDGMPFLEVLGGIEEKSARGIYTVKDLENNQLWCYIGTLVELEVYGTVIEGKEGYRSSGAKVVRILDTDKGWQVTGMEARGFVDNLRITDPQDVEYLLSIPMTYDPGDPPIRSFDPDEKDWRKKTFSWYHHGLKELRQIYRDLPQRSKLKFLHYLANGASWQLYKIANDTNVIEVITTHIPKGRVWKKYAEPWKRHRLVHFCLYWKVRSVRVRNMLAKENGYSNAQKWKWMQTWPQDVKYFIKGA